MRGPGILHGVKSDKLVGNHDTAPTLARMGGARFPAFVDGRSFLSLAQDPSTTWPRTAILSEEETNLNLPNGWDMLRTRGKVYTRYEDDKQKEYYDLARDPHQVHNALGAGDTTYLPPDSAILDYYEERLHALYACSGRSCRTAENAPLPSGGAP